MKKTFIKKLAAGAGTIALALPMLALAQNDPFGIENIPIQLTNQDIRVTIAGIVNAFMGLLGIVAVLIILLGGFKWMTAGGEEDKVKDAKRLIVQGIVGLIIIFSAYAIAQFVINALVSA